MLDLDAGSYGKLKVGNGATINFSGGLYEFSNWSVGREVNLYFAAPSEIRIAGQLRIGNSGYLGHHIASMADPLGFNLIAPRFSRPESLPPRSGYRRLDSEIRSFGRDRVR